MEFDPRNMSWEDAYRYLIGAVIPRPIAWVSSTSADGINNIAPFSFFNGFCARPMILGFAPMASDDRPLKDTLANVRALGEFVINISTEATLAAMDHTGGAFAPEVDEFAAAGLTPAPSVAVRPPRIAESPVNFECRLYELVPLGEGSGSATLVLGEVIFARVADAVIRDNRIDPALLTPVARLGGPLYARPELLPFRRAPRPVDQD